MVVLSVSDLFEKSLACRRERARTCARPAKKAVMPPKRKADGDATAQDAKKFRSALGDIASEFVCSITQELPVDCPNCRGEVGD